MAEVGIAFQPVNAQTDHKPYHGCDIRHVDKKMVDLDSISDKYQDLMTCSVRSEPAHQVVGKEHEPERSLNVDDNTSFRHESDQSRHIRTLSSLPATAIPTFEILGPIMSRLSIEIVDTQPLDISSSHIQITGGLAIAIDHSAAVKYIHSNLAYLDKAGYHLWKALRLLRPLSADYAGTFGHHEAANHSASTSTGLDGTRPRKTTGSAIDLVRRVFNWHDLILPGDVKGSFHGVVCRSKRAPGSEHLSPALYQADLLAHEEAVSSGGLLMYWYGVPSKDGMNRATCVWRDVASSKKASALPLHREAIKHARKAYETFGLSTYRHEEREGDAGLHIT